MQMYQRNLFYLLIIQYKVQCAIQKTRPILSLYFIFNRVLRLTFLTRIFFFIFSVFINATQQIQQSHIAVAYYRLLYKQPKIQLQYVILKRFVCLCECCHSFYALQTYNSRVDIQVQQQTAQAFFVSTFRNLFSQVERLSHRFRQKRMLPSLKDQQQFICVLCVLCISNRNDHLIEFTADRSLQVSVFVCMHFIAIRSTDDLKCYIVCTYRFFN
eukprot:TRINITY_DN6975_c0_g1_i5.p1 TRINITY_DN6975_c0_g1~~TRINITY_DN6975_c0_g1_i5.p1  ORF type:complete len:248 (-),score=-17.25 TRINITY_DN6975_c0_g1_i5:789-1430(-)